MRTYVHGIFAALLLGNLWHPGYMEYGYFSKEFMWGAGTSAYQVEGAWNENGKGPSDWDIFSQAGGNTYMNQTGDVACDSYHKTDEDIALLKNIGVSHYRFSISWARILPKGTTEEVNLAGIKHYSDFIDKLLANNVQPMVTLYHFDLPQALQDIGGWKNPEMADIFNDYAKVCFEELGDRVKWWLTINEPFIIAFLGHGLGNHAPGLKELQTAPYQGKYLD